MQLNTLPLFQRLSGARSVLIAGAGGGFDVFTGIPLYLALRAAGVDVHLANLSFSSLDTTDAEELTPCCHAVTAHTASDDHYFPERALAEWLLAREIETPIYAFDKTGVVPLTEAYQALMTRHALDAVVLVDGGTDSLMRGDEEGLGTPHEDMLSLAAVSRLDLPCKLLVCLGFGIDAYHGVCHAHFLEAVAELDRLGGYLGTFSLQRGMPEVDAYLEAVAYANAQIHGRPSIVNASIASALEGDYGDVHRTARTQGSKLWINPLMTLYWSFELERVARRVRYLHGLLPTQDFGQVVRFIEGFHKGVRDKRPWAPIPV